MKSIVDLLRIIFATAKKATGRSTNLGLIPYKKNSAASIFISKIRMGIIYPGVNDCNDDTIAS